MTDDTVSRIVSSQWDLNFHVTTFLLSLLWVGGSNEVTFVTSLQLHPAALSNVFDRLGEGLVVAAVFKAFVSWVRGSDQVPSGPSAPCTLVPKRGHDPVWRHWNISFWKVGSARCSLSSLSFVVFFYFHPSSSFSSSSCYIIFIILYLCHHHVIICYAVTHEIFYKFLRFSGGLRFRILQLSHSVAMLRTRFRRHVVFFVDRCVRVHVGFHSSTGMDALCIEAGLVEYLDTCRKSMPPTLLTWDLQFAAFFMWNLEIYSCCFCVISDVISLKFGSRSRGTICWSPRRKWRMFVASSFHFNFTQTINQLSQGSQTGLNIPALVSLRSTCLQ